MSNGDEQHEDDLNHPIGGERRPLRETLAAQRRIARLQPARSLVQSFNYAFEGVLYTLATQRNMRIHYSASAAAMIACVVLGVERTEFALIVLAATLVIVSEMINTAVEAAIDVATTSYNPLAKVAKDVAAGAVLIATFNALIVAYLVFGTRFDEPSLAMIRAVRETPVHVTFSALAVTFLGVIALKVVSGRRGTPLRGGFPSGHAAMAFAGWMAITFFVGGSEYGSFASVLTFMLALLVAQSRVESGVHTWYEVMAGAVLGALVTLVIFQLATFGR